MTTTTNTTGETGTTAKPKTRTRRTTKSSTGTHAAALSVVPTVDIPTETVDPTATTEATPTRLPVAVLHPNLRNVRRQVTDLDELTESVRVFGVLQPLTVAPHPDLPGEWVIIAGHRRHAAAHAAGISDVPVTVRADLVEPVDVIAAMLAENLHRADLSPIEEAAGYQQLLDLGLTEAAVAKRTGRSKTTVTRRLTLLQLPEETREKVHGHQVPLEQALILAEFADDPDAIHRLESELDDHGDLRWAAERERDTRTRQAALTQLRDQLTAAGWTLATWTRDETAPTSVVRMAKPLAFHEVSCVPAFRHLDPEERRAAHADCPHRAAYIFPAGDDWLEVCLNPTTHPTPPSTPTVAGDGRADTTRTDRDRPNDVDDLDDDEDDEAAAAEAEAADRQAEQDRTDCAAAARVRRDHLRQFTTGAVRFTDTQRTNVIRHAALLAVSTDVPFGYPDDLALAEALGLDVDTITADGDDEYAVERALRDAIRTLKDPVRGLLVALAAGSEQPLGRPDQWTPTRISGRESFAGDLDPLCHRAWLDLVTGPLGYQPTPWEAARLTTADQAAAPRAEDAQPLEAPAEQ
jgi:ParB/RepB/Spo0J family partition protein